MRPKSKIYQRNLRQRNNQKLKVPNSQDNETQEMLLGFSIVEEFETLIYFRLQSHQNLPKGPPRPAKESASHHLVFGPESIHFLESVCLSDHLRQLSYESLQVNFASHEVSGQWKWRRNVSRLEHCPRIWETNLLSLAITSKSPEWPASESLS